MSATLRFGFYLSFGNHRTREIEHDANSITLSFWRVTLCFARIDIEDLFKDMLGFLRTQDVHLKREDELKQREDELKQRIESLETRNHDGVQHELELQGQIDSLHARADDISDDLTDATYERDEYHKLAWKYKNQLENTLVYFRLKSDQALDELEGDEP